MCGPALRRRNVVRRVENPAFPRTYPHDRVHVLPHFLSSDPGRVRFRWWRRVIRPSSIDPLPSSQHRHRYPLRLLCGVRYPSASTPEVLHRRRRLLPSTIVDVGSSFHRRQGRESVRYSPILLPPLPSGAVTLLLANDQNGEVIWNREGTGFPTFIHPSNSNTFPRRGSVWSRKAYPPLCVNTPPTLPLYSTDASSHTRRRYGYRHTTRYRLEPHQR